MGSECDEKKFSARLMEKGKKRGFSAAVYFVVLVISALFSGVLHAKNNLGKSGGSSIASLQKRLSIDLSKRAKGQYSQLYRRMESLLENSMKRACPVYKRAKITPLADLDNSVPNRERARRIISISFKITQLQGLLEKLQYYIRKNRKELSTTRRLYRMSDLFLTVGTFGLSKKIPLFPMLLSLTKEVTDKSLDPEKRAYPRPLPTSNLNPEKEVNYILKLARERGAAFSYSPVVCYLISPTVPAKRKCIPLHPEIVSRLLTTKKLWDQYLRKVRENQLPLSTDILLEFIVKDELKRLKAERALLLSTYRLISLQKAFLEKIRFVLIRDYYFWGCHKLKFSKETPRREL